MSAKSFKRYSASALALSVAMYGAATYASPDYHEHHSGQEGGSQPYLEETDSGHHHEHHGRAKPHVSIEAPSGTRWGRDYFPNITLINQDGEERKFFDDVIKDKVVAINFIFTSCKDSCPLETAKMRDVQRILGDRVGKDIFLYSITIDPEVDTPEVLKAYMKKFNAGPGWEFLTGDEQEIISLREKFGVYLADLENDKENPDDHNLSMVIGNQKTGRWMKRSPFENPYVLASHLGEWLHNWKQQPKGHLSYVEAPKIRQISPGEVLFRTRCSSCHAFGENGVGPDLLNVAQKRDHEWLARWLKEPDKMLEEKDVIATRLYEKYKLPMPNMRLTDKDVGDLIGYMKEMDKSYAKNNVK